MKAYFIILGFILFLNTTGANALSYNNPYWKNSYRINPIYRPVYNPYGQYNSYQQYKNANRNNINRIKRMQKIRQMNRIKRNLNNSISLFNNRNNYYPGYLTGYSTPINTNVFSQLGISPDINSYKIPNTTQNTNLFSMPNTTTYCFQDGRCYQDIKGVSGTTGVKIIND